MSSRIQEISISYGIGLIRRQIAGETVEVALLVQTIVAGLPMAELAVLREALDLPMERVAAKVGMSRATFHRRQKTGVLSTDESDKAVRLARLFGHAVAVFGNERDARNWLQSRQRGLGGAVPLDYAETEVGAREVENLLGRIDHGVYA